MSTGASTDRDQALHEAAAALAAAADVLGLDELPAHLIDQARHLCSLAQQAIDRALFSDWS